MGFWAPLCRGEPEELRDVRPGQPPGNLVKLVHRIARNAQVISLIAVGVPAQETSILPGEFLGSCVELLDVGEWTVVLNLQIFFGGV